MTTLKNVYQAGIDRLEALKAKREELRKELDFAKNNLHAHELLGKEKLELAAMVKAGLIEQSIFDLAMTERQIAEDEVKIVQEAYRESPEVQALQAYETALAEVRKGTSVAAKSVSEVDPVVEPVDHLALSEDEKLALAADVRRRLFPQAKGLARSRKEAPNGRDFHNAFVEIGKTWMPKQGFTDKKWNYDFLVWADSPETVDILKAQSVPEDTQVKNEQPVATEPVTAPAREQYRSKGKGDPIDNDMDAIKGEGRKSRVEPKVRVPKVKADNGLNDAIVAAKAAKEAAEKAEAEKAAKALKRSEAAKRSAETRRKNKAAAEQAASQSAS